MKTYKDGWHTISGYKVYIEGGTIRRALSPDAQRPLYVYRKSRRGGWDLEEKITPDAFRAGLRRETITLH